ncbi:flippase [Spirosoma daeguense]
MKNLSNFVLKTKDYWAKFSFRKSIFSVGWLFFDKIFRTGTGMIVGIWLARYLGPVEYGLYNYVNVFPLILAPLASLGVNNILVSDIPVQDSGTVDRLIRTTISLKLLAGFTAFILVVIVSSIIHISDSNLIVLTAISSTTLIVQGFDVIDIYFQSIHKIHFSIIAKIATFAVATLVRVYGLWSHFELEFFIIVSVIETATGYLAIYWIYISQKGHSLFDLLFDRPIISRLLNLTWPLMLAEFFIFIYTRIDQIMLKHLAGNQELGIYGAALRLSEAWYFIAGALTTAFYPSIIILRKQDYNAYLGRYQKLLNILAVAGISIAIIFSVFSHEIVDLLYGNKYKSVGLILSIHIWTGVFVFMAVGTNNWFVVENMQRFLLGRTAVGALINILLNFYLIPAYGALGASVATLLAQVFAAYLTNGIYSRTKEVFQLQTKALFFFPRLLFSMFVR